jgi:hypothetical protein
MGQKTLMYVRDDTAVDQLQKIVSKYASKTRLGLCYSYTLEADKEQMKLMLVQGELEAVASCVAFEHPMTGLKHMVFCHPVATRDEFVRCCAPAVEADEIAYLHLMFNNNDVDVLTAILNHQYPDRKTLANVYRKTRELMGDREGKASAEPCLVTIEEIAEAMDLDGPKELIISNCMAVFEEIGLAKRQEMGGKMAVSLPPAPQQRHDLRDSPLYATGDRLKSEWAKFSNFILRRTGGDIRKMLLETVISVE